MSDTLSEVREDFDQLAHLPGSGFDHNRHYHGLLLHNLPQPCERALEIGCGTGDFARLLAGRCTQVTALDLSPEMIRVARQKSQGFSNIDFQVADAIPYEFPPEQWDCIASIATFHHLPFEQMLPRMECALRPGGILLILDLYSAQTLADFLTCGLAVPINLLLRLLKTGHLRDSKEVRAFWDGHGHLDHYPTLPHLRSVCARYLPGACVRRLLFFRYLLSWRKP